MTLLCYQLFKETSKIKCDLVNITSLVSLVLGTLVTDALQEYIERYSPVYPGVEGRITFVKPNNKTDSPSPTESTSTGNTRTTEGNSGTEGTTKRITRFLYCPDMDYANEASSLFIQQNRIIVLITMIFYINLLF